jgi:hypothetical protein
LVDDGTFGGDVAFCAYDPQQAAGGITLSRAARMHMAHSAVGGPDDAEGAVKLIEAGRDGGHGSHRGGAVFGVEACGPIRVAAVKIGAGDAVDFERAIVPRALAGNGVPSPNAEGGGAGREGEALVELLQIGGRPARFRDVRMNRR